MTKSLKRFTFLQKQEIETGKAHGLLEEEIKVYRKRYFNYRQMEEIRTGFEQGLSERDIRRYAHFWINADHMREMRESLKLGDREDVPVYLPGGITGKDFMFMFMILLVCVLSTAGFVRRMTRERLRIELTQDEVTLQCGDTFQPQAYVSYRTAGEDTEMIYPSGISTLVPQEVLVVYRLVRGGESVEKQQRIHIVDEVPPDLLLQTDSLEIEENSEFYCTAYVQSAVDAVNGDLRGDVSCSSELTPGLSRQDVVFSVSDHAGNTSTAVMSVLTKKEEVPVTESADEEVS